MDSLYIYPDMNIQQGSFQAPYGGPKIHQISIYFAVLLSPWSLFGTKGNTTAAAAAAAVKEA